MLKDGIKMKSLGGGLQAITPLAQANLSRVRDIALGNSPVFRERGKAA